ncbi:glycosyltransferase family 2 protein [Dawidia soli]|uniref:Glycosyltransferase family 2 protein n=1 Tax=Dawidia soli TaxID=2782352 RepID=A0AAP2D6Z1_9BACT|nr:glycosyltransferase family 2 protein [Dawidia soli]MBT1685721.1 glycosyltransferase family 2 protein [Dawidia soli]
MTMDAAFEQHKACVLIPTYNNLVPLAHVLHDVLQYTRHVIVVNDGAVDGTREMLARQYPQVALVDYAQNRGKGYALRQGFARAVALGYTYAITIDSDGQHYADDLPVFLKKLETSPNAIIIGARNMDQASVPGKSSFGNKFSNFWYKVETGLSMRDTQSGYRVYPVKALQNFTFVTRKYEFEIEVLVRAAWAGIEVTEVPVKVFYPEKEKRISHFRPFRDFSRISVLNTVLVTITFLYIKPRDLFRGLKKKTSGKSSAKSAANSLTPGNRPG